jgi:hypothetical protein
MRGNLHFLYFPFHFSGITAEEEEVEEEEGDKNTLDPKEWNGSKTLKRQSVFSTSEQRFKLYKRPKVRKLIVLH